MYYLKELNTVLTEQWFTTTLKFLSFMAHVGPFYVMIPRPQSDVLLATLEITIGRDPVNFAGDQLHCSIAVWGLRVPS